MAVFPADDPQHPLWREDDRAVDEALTAALPTARADERPGIVRLLLQRGHVPALVGLVEGLGTWGPLERRMIHDAAEKQLDGAIRTLIGRGSGDGCRHALALIRDHRLTRLAYLLTELIRHGREGLPNEAAAVLVRLASDPDLPAKDRQALASAVGGAIARYDRHGHRGVLDAFLALLTEDLGEARAALQDKNHPAVRALRKRLAEPTDPASRRALLPMLAWPTLAGAARDGLVFAARDATLGQALSAGHRLRDPVVVKGLEKLADPAPLLLDPAARGKIAPEALRWLPALWAALPVSSGKRIQHLANLHDDPEPAVRVAAVNELLRLGVTPLDATARQRYADALAKFGRDGHEPIARLAARSLDREAADRNTGSDTKPLTRLADAPHASVRAVPGRRLGPGAFERLWKTGHRLDADRLAAALRALRKLDADFDRRLMKQLLGQPAAQVRALGWVYALETPDALADHAARLAGSEHVKVAASAAVALSRSADPATLPLLESLTGHANGRVRANAVEALDRRRMSESFRGRLVELVGDDTARPRANAIRALLNVEADTALRALRDMLRDPRPDHRRSALWLVDAAGVMDIAKQSERARADLAAPTEEAKAGADPADRSALASDPADPAATVRQLLGELYGDDADAKRGAAA